MKKTHYSTGVYDRSFLHSPTRRLREKHTTACGSVCDHTKATTEKSRVTCRKCLKRMS